MRKGSGEGVDLSGVHREDSGVGWFGLYFLPVIRAFV